VHGKAVEMPLLLGIGVTLDPPSLDLSGNLKVVLRHVPINVNHGLLWILLPLDGLLTSSLHLLWSAVSPLDELTNVSTILYEDYPTLLNLRKEALGHALPMGDLETENLFLHAREDVIVVIDPLFELQATLTLSRLRRVSAGTRGASLCGIH
jgi:hypothetical protein